MTNKTIAELRELIRECKVDHNFYTPEEKFDEILSRAEAEPKEEGFNRKPLLVECRRCKGKGFFEIPEQDGSIGELDCCYCSGTGVIEKKRPPTPAKEEPLAVLAYRKGQVVVLEEGLPSYYNEDKNADRFFVIRLADKRVPDNWREYRGPTYASAESKARAYLNGLPDVKGEGKV